MEPSFPSGSDKLPLHRRRLEAVCRNAMGEPSVLGMLIGGSFASGEADVYSDLDMQLVVEDEAAVETTSAELRHMAEGAGPVVAAFYAEHVGLPHMLIVLYEDLIHADFEPIAVSRVGPRNAGLAAHVLWERDGIVSSALPATHEDDPATDLRWIEDRVWTWSWYIQTKVLRGELYEALDGLQYVRDSVRGTLGWILLVAYLTIGWNIRGRTVGKRALGLRAVTSRDVPLPLWRSFVRATLYAVFPIGLFWCAVSSRRESVQDLIVRTRGVYDWVPSG